MQDESTDLERSGDEDGPYAVIELVRGPNWTPGNSVGLIALQLRHMRTLWRLRQRGLVLAASPVTGMEPIRGLVVVRERDVEATLGALNQDDAVRLGRLEARVAKVAGPDPLQPD